MKIGTGVRLDCVSCGNGCGDSPFGWCVGICPGGASIHVMLATGRTLECPAKHCVRNLTVSRRLFVPNSKEEAAQFLGLQAKHVREDGSSGPTLKVVAVIYAAREVRLLTSLGTSGGPVQMPTAYDWLVGHKPSSTEEGLYWLGKADCLLTPLTIIGDQQAAEPEEDDTVRCARELRIRLGYTGPASSPKRMEDQSWGIAGHW